MGEQKKPDTEGWAVQDYNGRLHLCETLDPVTRISGDRNQSGDGCEARIDRVGHKELAGVKEMFSVLLGFELHEEIQLSKPIRVWG